mmetsp:Transcript_7412/g.19210  ORF Transcript_7412/g.19210 Transcript_7412/m.19210 type:complete len:82 (+) Transcript_7412:160-405(+)
MPPFKVHSSPKYRLYLCGNLMIELKPCPLQLKYCTVHQLWQKRKDPETISGETRHLVLLQFTERLHFLWDATVQGSFFSKI